MAALKMATFNLYHFAEPGIFWHERKPAATYSQTQWAEKKAWITSMVAGMDADVIGFQEVVSQRAAIRISSAPATRCSMRMIRLFMSTPRWRSPRVTRLSASDRFRALPAFPTIR